MTFFGRCGRRNNSDEVYVCWKDGKQAIEHGVRRFANPDDAQIGNIAKIIFNISAAKHAVRATDAAGNRIRNVQRFEGSKENLPRE
jgi:hypothetical protein